MLLCSADSTVIASLRRPKQNFESDAEALFDSFLLTQNTATTKLTFWIMGTSNTNSTNSVNITDTNSNNRGRVGSPLATSFVKRYEAIGKGAIEFRLVDVVALAEGTCLEGKTSQWVMRGTKIPLQSKSDLLRLLLLWRFGGVCPPHYFANTYQTTMVLLFF
jgi:hypothetical protein